MKQFKSIHFIILFSVLSSAVVLGQKAKTISDGLNDLDGDGITDFTITSYDSGITKTIIDSSAEILILRPTIDTLLFKQPNGWTLSGKQWQYNNQLFSPGDVGYLNHAVDVDNISQFFTGGRLVYLITDLTQNKVVVREPNVVPGISFNYSNPDHAGLSDANLYIDGAGNRSVLVTYKATNSVLKIDYDFKDIRWSYGGDGVLSSPSDAENVPGTDNIIIADTGGRRVIIINTQNDSLLWNYQEPGNSTFSPVDVEMIGNDEVLITDQIGNRVFIVDMQTQSIVWPPNNRIPGSFPTALNLPVDADWIADRQAIVIADKGNNRIFEVSRSDSTYFYEWPNPTFEVEDVDVEQDSAFLAVQRETVNGSNIWLPTRLAFAPPADKGPVAVKDSLITDASGNQREVDFNKIFINAQNTSETRITYQLRSSPLNIDIKDSDPWIGPEGSGSSYTYIDSTVHELFSWHKPHTSVQFGAYLTTQNKRVTPRIDSVGVIYNYYQVLQDSFPSITLRPDSGITIGPDMNAPVSVAWDTLTLKWNQGEVDPRYLDDLEFNLFIRNRNASDPTRNLVALHRQKIQNGLQRIVLINETGLRGAKQITFELELITLNSGLTPQLEGWRFSWREFENGPPAIQFTDSSFVPVEFYTSNTTLPGPNDSTFVNRAFLSLTNALEASDSLDVDVVSSSGDDIETIRLNYNAVNLRYESEPIDIILLDPLAQNPQPSPGNGILELFDRELLFVEFRSDQRPGEVLQDTVMVVQGTIGSLFIQNSVRQDITQAQIGQTLHLRVTGEMDRSLDPIRQDSIRVLLQNDMTSDTELTTLYEDSSGGIFNTGVFITQMETLLSDNSNSPPNDGQLYSRMGDRISAQYKDNYLKAATYRFIVLPDSLIIDQALSDLVIEVAPNPYRERDGYNFRMRVKSDLGDLTLEKVEIYNFAGELVQEMVGNTLSFSNSVGNVIPIYQWGYVDNWWNLLNSSGQGIASGTYWAKIKASVNQQTLSAVTKFVVIR